jgi:putative hydrolase of the HAD superfamily
MFMMKAKAIIFDLDNTLYDETSYLQSIFTAFFKSYKKQDVPDDIMQKITPEFRCANADVLQGMLQLIQANTKQNHDEIFQLYCHHQANINLTKAVKTLLVRFKEQGFKLGVLTNGVITVQRNKVNLLSITELVDVVVYARENGASFEKPHQQAFTRVCQQLNVDTEEAIMVGDNIKCDIEGALNAGLSVVYLKNEYTKEKRLSVPTITQLHELEKLINYDD